MEDIKVENLKYLILGYRKNSGKTQSELALELQVSLEIETALELIPINSLLRNC